MKIYFIEDMESGLDNCGYTNLEEIRKVVVDYYAKHLKEMFKDYSKSQEEMLDTIEEDFENLSCSLPYIEDTLWVHAIEVPGIELKN